MATATLVHRHIFGMREDVRNNVDFTEEYLVVYPAGHSVVIYSLEDKKQKFIHGSENSEGITATAVCQNKRFLAIAEKGDRGIVNIYDIKTLKKRKVLTTPECQSKSYISICFSADNQLLLTQGGPPDWTLVCWNWSKAKPIAWMQCPPPPTVSVPNLYQCSFSVLDPAVVCCTGNGLLKFYRILDNTFRPIPTPRVDIQNFSCHTWIRSRDDHILVCTFSGDILLFQAGELLTRIPDSPGDGRTITSIVSTSNGFICGADADLFVYEFSDTSESLSESIKFIKSVKVEASDAKITDISISPSEDRIICSLSNKQVYIVTCPRLNVLKPDDVEFLFSSCHKPDENGHAQITGLDVCVKKQMVVTCGLDKTVRIWNYVNMTLELNVAFNEEAYSISFHPSGLHVLVGFSDKLRLMNILMDDIRPIKEFALKSCRECQFSNGGHLFAAVNGNTIHVFSTYTCEMLGQFRGHNGKVRCLYWTMDDSRLISAGLDGSVYQWDVDEAKREVEFVQKGCHFTSALCNAEGNVIYAVGTDKTLKEIEVATSHVNNELVSTSILGQIVLSRSQKMFFATTAEPERPGCIRSYEYPLTGEFTEYQCASSPISRLRVSYDDRYVFVAGEDGSLCILEIKEKETRSKPLRDVNDEIPFAEEILVTKSDLEEKNGIMQELKNKVDELTLHNEYQLRLKDMNYNEKMKEVAEKFTQELEQDRNQYEILKEEKNDMELENEERIKQMEEKHHQKMQEMEAGYQQKIMNEVEIYQEILEKKNAEQKKWEEEKKTILSMHEKYVTEITEDFEQRLEENAQLRLEMEEGKDEIHKEFQETKNQMEEDIDFEIEEMKLKYENQLVIEREATLRYKGENGIMKKKFSTLQKDIEYQRDEIKALLDKEKELYEQIKCLEREIQIHKREIRSRDETIGEKERRIYELKKKNQELEKFKFVLDYKIKELKKQIEPRENEISDMKKQIKDMDLELELFHKSNAQLDLMIGELRNRLNAMQQEIMKQRRQIGEQQNTLRMYRCDFHDAVQLIQDPKALKEAIQIMHKKYLQDELTSHELDNEIQNEYLRQKEYLEKSVYALKTKFNKDANLHRQDNMKVMKDNMLLIKEINELRNTVQQVKANVQMEKAALVATRGPRSHHDKLLSKDHKLPWNDQVIDTSSPSANVREILEEQKKKMEELRETIKKLEGSTTTTTYNHDRVYPLQRVDG